MQTGLPPTYEEHRKYAMMSRSHTPPPPWSDSTTTTSSFNPASSIQARRELLASQPELHEYLAQLTLSDRGSQYQYQQQRQQSRDAICSAPREQQVRVQQRARAMPPRWVVEEAGMIRVDLGRRVSYLRAGIAHGIIHVVSGSHMRLRHRRESARPGIYGTTPRYFEVLRTSSGFKVV